MDAVPKRFFVLDEGCLTSVDQKMMEFFPELAQQDWDGNYLGFLDLHLSSTDLARFGLMDSNEGVYEGQQIVPSAWVNESLRAYSRGTWKYRVGRNWGANACRYRWWSITAADHRYNLAWEHGGQQVA